MRTAVCKVATAPGSTVVSALPLRALVVVVVVGCLLSGCLPVDGRPVADVERTKLAAEEDAAISALELRQRRSVDAVSSAGDQLLQQQQLSSRVHAAIVDVIRERRRLRRDAAADKSTVTPPNGTPPRKGYGSNSYWNRSGWGGGYGK
jgi:hypothetical protein